MLGTPVRIQVNTNNATGKYEYKAICTINGFWMDVHDRENYQPSPKWMGDLQAGQSFIYIFYSPDFGLTLGRNKLINFDFGASLGCLCVIRD